MTDPRARARTTAILAAVIGLFAATAVITYFKFGSVLAAIRPIGGGGFVAVIAAQIALFAPLGLAWWTMSQSPRERIPVFMWGRLMREAASDVLPFSQVGGVVIATRAMVLGGVSAGVSLGSCVVDITFEIVAQLIYTLFGLALLAHQLGFDAHNHALLLSLLVGVIAVAVAVTVIVATRKRGLGLVQALVDKVAPSAAQQTAAMSRAIDAAYARPLGLWIALALHISAWFGAAAGSWLILRLIGHPLPFLSMVAIESLLFAIRNAAFIVPSGLGVQEGAYALLGPLFGLPAEAALALSLIKRARDIAIGVPMLITWQMVEGRARIREKTAETV